MTKPHLLPAVRSWVINPVRRWFACCDRCDRRRLVATYYEVYGERDAEHLAACDHCREKEAALGSWTWWYECAHCLIVSISDLPRL